jgi:hypothetical protein
MLACCCVNQVISWCQRGCSLVTFDVLQDLNPTFVRVLLLRGRMQVMRSIILSGFPLLPRAAAVLAVLLFYFICAGLHQRQKNY